MVGLLSTLYPVGDGGVQCVWVLTFFGQDLIFMPMAKYKTYDKATTDGLLGKVRKGATASFNMSQVRAVVLALGGTWDDTVRWVRIGGDYKQTVWCETNAEAVTVLARAKNYIVASEPPVVLGHVYLDHLLLRPGNDGSEDTVVEYKGWVGAPCVAVSLGGVSKVVTPDPYDTRKASLVFRGETFTTGHMLGPSDVVRWLGDETDWVARASAALGVDQHVPAAARTREGTGTCGLCFRNIKIPGGVLAFHGYRRPGTGYTEGQCDGTGRRPFEVSVEVTRERRDNLERLVTGLKSLVATLVAGDYPNKIPYGLAVVDRDHPSRATAEAHYLGRIQMELATTEEEWVAFGELGTHWKPRPLPVEGGVEVDWYYEGRKP